MTEQIIGQFAFTLKNLDGILQKAAAHADHRKFDVNNFVTARLAPDMLPFARQVQIACDAAKFCAARFTGTEAPKFEDTESTWPQLRERITKTLTFLDSVKGKKLVDAKDVKYSPPQLNGQYLQGEDYLLQSAIPNFYFHVTTAYALLREGGVEIGKKDYLGPMSLRS